MSDSTVQQIEFHLSRDDFVSLIEKYGTEIGLPKLAVVIDPDLYTLDVFQRRDEKDAPVRVTFTLRDPDEEPA